MSREDPWGNQSVRPFRQRFHCFRDVARGQNDVRTGGPECATLFQADGGITSGYDHSLLIQLVFLMTSAPLMKSAKPEPLGISAASVLNSKSCRTVTKRD